MESIKNIAFDFGGVVLALSLQGAIKAFEKIGVKVAQSLGIHTLCPHDNEDWTLFPEIQKLLQE